MAGYMVTLLDRRYRKMTQLTNHEAAQKVLAKIKECYGSLREPNFRRVSDYILSDPFRTLKESFVSSGVSVIDTTDINDDVSSNITFKHLDDWVQIALSGVGPYAIVFQKGIGRKFEWITSVEQAATPMASLVVERVQAAGFELVGRDLVSQKIDMEWWDGTTSVSFYQLLFSDYEIPS